MNVLHTGLLLKQENTHTIKARKKTKRLKNQVSNEKQKRSIPETQKMKKFYITTPLYYINDKPHLGTAYSTILADVLSRYHRLTGSETFLMTGVDEHGQKCAQSAKQKNRAIQEYCDEMVGQFENTWKLLDISYDHFFRTTSPRHKTAVQKCLQELYDRKQIYESTYEGWYCVSEETFYTSKDLVNGKSPFGKEVTKIKEKNYFFKMSAYRQALNDHIHQNPDFIQPTHRKNEVLSFLKKGLEDLCISRPKSRVDWGVEVPFDNNYVTYVWVDALLNYATGVGYQDSKRKQDFKKWWTDTGALHVIGKDILITHSVYWPCLLMALGIRLPKSILAHGWILDHSRQKMSKSKGDVMDPLALLKVFDSDSLRYFLIRDVPVGNDSPVSHNLILQRRNEDLSNNFGNLLRRVTQMIHRHFASRVPKREKEDFIPAISNLREKGVQTTRKFKADISALKPHLALEKIVLLLNETNRFLEQNPPWKSIKTDKEKTSSVLRAGLEIIYLSAVLLKPVLPRKMSLLLKALSCPDEWPLQHFQSGAFPKAGHIIQDLPPLFPRITQETKQ